MAKNIYYVWFVLLLYACNGVALHETSIGRPAPNISAANDTVKVVIDTVSQPEAITDTAQRLPTDPPIYYQPTPPPVAIQTKPNVRERVQVIYFSQVGVRELTGNNDGKAVEMYLRSVGLGKGYSYCAAFVHWTFDSAGLKNPITAWSPTAHNSKNLVWFKNKLEKEPRPGDVFCIWFGSKKRIAHTGFVNKKINGSVFETVEANTSEAGSEEGDGVYKRRRSFNATYSITRWIED